MINDHDDDEVKVAAAALLPQLKDDLIRLSSMPRSRPMASHSSL